MDAKKLAALRTRYADAAGADIDDPEFRRAASLQFSEGDRRKRPFADPATFLGAPFRPDGSLDGLDVALVGVPMDLGVTDRAGSAPAPCARWSASGLASTSCA